MTVRVRRPGVWIETAAVAVLAAAVFVVHPYGYMTTHPYWIDESWVALLSKAPLRVIGSSSSTPIGWLLLVRWAPVGRDQLRIVPLLFVCGDVVMAYVVARSLPWKTPTAARFAGTVAGVLVLLAPMSVVRNDLKQYTSDAFFALVIIALACRYEAEPSRRRLVHLVLGAVVSVAFSTVAAFVSAAVFSSLVIVTLASRATNVLRDISVAAVATAFALGGYFLVLIIPHSSASLRGYWRGYYLDGGPFHEITVTWHRLSHLAPNFAMPEIAIVALLVLGTIFIAGLGRKAIALAIPLLWIEMMILATLERYPFLDQRTSQFLVITSLTVIAVGVAGLIISLASRSRILAVVLTLVVAGGFWRGAEPHIRSHGAIQNEDVRSQVQYVVQHRHDGDVIVVSLESVYAFGYYWPGAKNAYFVDHTGTNATGYTTRVTNLADVVYADGRMTQNTTDAMRQAIALAKEPGGTDRIWLVRTHLGGTEKRAWNNTYATFALHPQPIRVGSESLTLIDLRAPP